MPPLIPHEICYSADKQSPSVCWQHAEMPSGRRWLKGRHCPWAMAGSAWGEDTDDTPALWRREQSQWLFLVWKCLTPLVDSLVLFVGRVSHIVRGAGMALDSMLKWGQWICTCGWKMNYLAECSSMWNQQAEVCHLALVGECWHCSSSAEQVLVILFRAGVRQHILHTHGDMFMVD